MECTFYHEFVFAKAEFIEYLVIKAGHSPVAAMRIWELLARPPIHSWLRVVGGDLRVVVRVPIPDDPVA